MDSAAVKRFSEIAGEDAVFINEPMSRHTTFRIGGPADYFLIPHSEEETVQLVESLKEFDIPYFLMGNGSNLLVSDRGFRGAVIRFGREFGTIRVKGECIEAEAGALLSQIAAAAAEHSLTGMEFAAGIPGTLGGACMMNAGAYGGEMKQVLVSVRALDRDGRICELSGGELGLGYRTSVFERKHMYVLGAKMQLKRGESEAIRNMMEELREKRTSKQPLELPSAGSTFKRPEGYFAGKLIMDSGLRGYQIGGARVSEKHCGFIVNAGGATAADVYSLIAYVRDKVNESFGVALQTEVRLLGEF